MKYLSGKFNVKCHRTINFLLPSLTVSNCSGWASWSSPQRNFKMHVRQLLLSNKVKPQTLLNWNHKYILNSQIQFLLFCLRDTAEFFQSIVFRFPVYIQTEKTLDKKGWQFTHVNYSPESNIFNKVLRLCFKALLKRQNTWGFKVNSTI